MQQLVALQQTSGTADLAVAETRITIAGAGQHRPISALLASRPRVSDAKHPAYIRHNQWKDQQTKGTTTQPLRVVLGQMVIQEILDRFTKLQSKDHQDPLWQKAIQQNHHHSRGIVALPAVGSDAEEASSVAQQDPYQGGEDSESLGGSVWSMHEESGTPPAVQKSPTATDLQEDSDPLPDPGQFAGQSPLRHPVCG